MSKRILILNGHPDASPERLCAALATAYGAAALAAGNDVRRIDVGALQFPLIASAEEFIGPVRNEAIASAQADIAWAQHIVLIYPLWLGSLPALFKGFLEQVFRYGFALNAPGTGMIKGLLVGRSAHVIVTMGMPKVIYWSMFGAFSTRALERGMLKLCGIAPVRHTHIGNVANAKTARKAVTTAAFLGANA